MDREIKVVTDKATIIKGDGWGYISAVDFNGASVEFQGQNLNVHPFRTNSRLKRLANATITNDNVFLIFANNSALQELDNITFTATEGGYMFENSGKLQRANIKCDNIEESSSGWLKGCGNLTDVTLSAKGLKNPNVTTASSDGMFYGDSQLKNVDADFRSITKGTNIFNRCTSLQYVNLIVNASNSSWTQSNFSIPSDAPCQAHKYVCQRNDGNARLIFTVDDLGDSDTYNQIDCTDDDRIETITADTIVVLSDGGSYIAEPPAGPPENPHRPINITVIINGIYVTTTPSILSRGKFTWSTTEQAGYTKWQDKLWFKYTPAGHIAVTTKYDVPISLPNRQIGDYYTADFRLDAITTDAEGNGNIVFNGTTSRQEWRLCRWYDGQSYYNIGGSMNYQAKQYLPDGERITRTCGNNFIKDENGEILWEGTPQTSVNFLDFAVRFCKVSIWDFKYYSKDGTLLMHLIPDSLGGFKDDVTGIVYGEGLANLQYVED